MLQNGEFSIFSALCLATVKLELLVCLLKMDIAVPYIMPEPVDWTLAQNYNLTRQLKAVLWTPSVVGVRMDTSEIWLCSAN